MVPRLFVLRHAESEFNASEGAVDTRDCDLSPQGEAQAKALGGLHFHLAIVSPLRRARRTLYESGFTIGDADDAAAGELPKDGANPRVKMDHLAREVRLDVCDFMDGEEIWPLRTEVGEEEEKRSWRESPEQVRERVHALWRVVMDEATALVSASSGGMQQQILIVSHSDFLWHFTANECDLVNAEMAEITHLLAARLKN